MASRNRSVGKSKKPVPARRSPTPRGVKPSVETKDIRGQGENQYKKQTKSRGGKFHPDVTTSDSTVATDLTRDASLAEHKNFLIRMETQPLMTEKCERYTTETDKTNDIRGTIKEKPDYIDLARPSLTHPDPVIRHTAQSQSPDFTRTCDGRCKHDVSTQAT